jgi:hypothetical protein
MLGSTDWQSEEDLNWRKKIVECEIEYCGYSARGTLGMNFSYPLFEGKNLNHQFIYFRWYQAPISFGPMGQTLSFLSKTLCQEQMLAHMNDESFKTFVYVEREKAMNRFLLQLNAVDEFTQSYGIEVPYLLKEAELKLLDSVFGPGASGTDVAEKVTLFLGEFYSVGVQMRLDRLYAVAEKVREQIAPPVFNRAPEAIRQAYFTFRNHCVREGESSPVAERWQRHCREDAAQDALMVLAMHQWKPEVRCKPRIFPLQFTFPYCFVLFLQASPEHLAITKYQTVARLRTKIFRRLSPGLLAIFKHQHTVDDLEVFFIVTALLSEDGNGVKR